MDVMRAIGTRLLGLVGTIVTARMLSPYDFGLVAIGTTILAFGNMLDDGGIGTALLRRPEEPTKSELQALLAFQVALDLAIVAFVALVTLPFGMVGKVTTVIVASLSLSGVRAPAVILYERRLDFRALAVVEWVETGVYYTWAIATITLGWGVWGLATGFIVRAFCGTLLILLLLPDGQIKPVPSWSKLKGLFSFGVRYQAVGLLHMLRDQGVNIVIGVLGGVAALGLWGVAWRIFFQLPISLIAAFWRVSFPGMSRLVAAKEDVGATIERVISLIAIGTGAVLAPLEHQRLHGSTS